MPVYPEPERRWPKRQRTLVVYREPAGSDDELDEDSGPATIDEGGSSDSDEDWALNPRRKEPKAKKPKVVKPRPFPFMRLPPELREAVYVLVVGSPDGVMSIEPSPLTNARLRRTLDESPRPEQVHWPSFAERKRFRNLRLLRVSKAIYAEAAVVLYTKQQFSFRRLSALSTFLLLLRPETLDRITNVHVDVRESEWTAMPGVASQLLQLHYLQTLKLSGLGYTTSSRNFSKYLLATNRDESTWPVTLESYDKMRGIKLARDLYPFLYPFFNVVIRAGPAMAKQPLPEESQDTESALGNTPTPSPSEDTDATLVQGLDDHTNETDESPYKPLIGIDALGRALEVDQGIPQIGWYQYFLSSSWFNQFESNPMTDQRAETRRTALKEELLTLMGRDSF